MSVTTHALATLVAGSTAGGAGWGIVHYFLSEPGALCRAAASLIEQALLARERSAVTCTQVHEDSFQNQLEKAVEVLSVRANGVNASEELGVLRESVIRLCYAGPWWIEAVVGGAVVAAAAVFRFCVDQPPAAPAMRAVRRRIH